MCSYIKVEVYVTSEHSDQTFALKLDQILSVYPQVTHPRPSNSITMFKLNIQN